MLSKEDIINVYRYKLHIGSNIIPIKTIFDEDNIGKYNYNPYYQRQYVWNKLEKAPYFIESVIIGAEIPPIVLFEDEQGIEVVDGRQRFETIKKFLDGEIKLSALGITVLIQYKDKYYFELPKEVQELFLNTRLRFIKINARNEEPLKEEMKDYIKRNIFKRYNSNIVPLKGIELDRAKYYKHDLSQFLKNKLLSDKNFYSDFVKMFLDKKSLNKLDDIDTLEKALRKIRYMTVFNLIPIKYYVGSKDKKLIIEKFYTNISEYVDNHEEFYIDLKEKIEILNKYRRKIINSKVFADYKIFEVLYWVINIIKKENADISLFTSDEIISNFVLFIKQKDENFYKKMKIRYIEITDFYRKVYNVNFDIYLSNSTNMQINENYNLRMKSYKEIMHERIRKGIPVNPDVRTLMKDLQTISYLLRPVFQRKESRDESKASSIIESLLLGYPLPPIFMYVREDGIHEVIDGQQRLLSILAFLGKDYMNEKGEMEKSVKKNFKLQNLDILTNLDGKTFDDLSKDERERIFNANIDIIEIDYELYKNFDPVDLFIRLNNKSNPILPNTFEMWNALLDKNIAKMIKEKTKKYSGWFYLKTEAGNSRMKNEELYTTLAILQSNYSKNTHKDILKVVYENNKFVIRLKNRKLLTDFLVLSNKSIYHKKVIIKSINEVEEYIKKLKLLLVSESKVKDEHLFRALTDITKSRKRNLKMHYLLWYLLVPLSKETIQKNHKEIRRHIKNIFEKIQNRGLQKEKIDLEDLKINLQLYKKNCQSKYKNCFGSHAITNLNKDKIKIGQEKKVLNKKTNEIFSPIISKKLNNDLNKSISVNMPVTINLGNQS